MASIINVIMVGDTEAELTFDLVVERCDLPKAVWDEIIRRRNVYLSPGDDPRITGHIDLPMNWVIKYYNPERIIHKNKGAQKP